MSLRHSVAAALVAFAGYSLLAWPTAGWFDGGELVASAWGLGVSHPPGHPLHALTAAFVVRLPLGPIALRVALASAAAMAVAVGFVAETVWAATASIEASETARRRWASVACALFGTSALAVGQAVRPEVYALDAALVAGAIWGAVRFVISGDARALALAGLFVGLGGANHHLLTLLVVPSVAAAAWSDVREPARARRAVWAALAFAVFGLLAYAYLPLRAGAATSISSPRTVAELWEVASARVYQRAALGEAPGSFVTRALDVAAILVLGTGGLFALLALAGAYVIGRVASVRRLLAVVGLPIVVYPLVRSWLGFSRGNPDAEGYLLPAIAAMAIAIGILLAVGHGLSMAKGGAGKGAVAALALVACSTFGLGVGETLARSTAPEEGAGVYAETVLDGAPNRAELIFTSFETYFVVAQAQACGSPRPDLSLVGLPFLGYPGRAREIVRADPGLRDFVRGVLLEGAIPETEIAALAAERPVLLELDPHAVVAVRPYLTPVGPLALVHGEPRAAADLVATAQEHFARWDSLYSRLGDAATKGETSKVLAWRHFQDAILYAARGEREAATRSASFAARHAPDARELVRLRRALERGSGPIDVEPLQVRTPP